MTAFVSVVVPTFNRPAALASCLDALARQDYPADRYEMIVVDDGSAPTEAAAIAETATRHRVRLVRQENRGPAAARNAGVREAHGAYIAFTDDDCMPAPGWKLNAFRPEGIVSIMSLLTTRSCAALDTSTTGVSPLTVMVSAREPMRISILTVAVNEPVS